MFKQDDFDRNREILNILFENVLKRNMQHDNRPTLSLPLVFSPFKNSEKLEQNCEFQNKRKEKFKKPHLISITDRRQLRSKQNNSYGIHSNGLRFSKSSTCLCFAWERWNCLNNVYWFANMIKSLAIFSYIIRLFFSHSELEQGRERGTKGRERERKMRYSSFAIAS